MYVISLIFSQIIISQNNITCEFCKKIITSKYIIDKDNKYHFDCYENHIQLKCDYCKKTIRGKYNKSENNNYHSICYKNNILEKCDICYLPIEGKYIVDSWENIYHEKHLNHLPSCESCNRIISKEITNGGYKINQKRDICTLCWGYVVDEKSNVQAIYDDVIKKLNYVGIMDLPKNIPIILVNTKNDLKRLSKGNHGNIHGLTKHEFKVLEKKKVAQNFKIYILSHLHEINFKAVLAHEILHVYLFQNNIELSPSYTEGFCNLGSQLVYNEDKSKISELKLKGMYLNKDPVYGEGFIKMNDLLIDKGWRGVLNFLNIKSKY